ncbi:secreted protein [Legionella lansingensis]|uniref:Secreted protein n=1 Tax=Legionella lansingensis TaxID=45067 RepID=A0A0W0VS57_9GAMM|nr:RimK/LysX family protein [Legionella lansingensis]KTD22781.1 secreted protein [Legionella lansingensis]SNV57183.1 secreted protein [Legionella lansingensis]
MSLRGFLIVILSLLSGCCMAANQKVIYGYVEKATLVDKGMVLSAKLDTGAKSASLSAIDIHEIEEDGKAYLRFKVPGKNEEVEFTCEYVGKVKIKVRAGEHLSLHHIEPIRRPVVLIGIQIGKKKRTIPVNLTNRKRFNYPLLLGRDAIIAFDGLVDPQHAFLIKTEKVEKNELK